MPDLGERGRRRRPAGTSPTPTTISDGFVDRDVGDLLRRRRRHLHLRLRLREQPVLGLDRDDERDALTGSTPSRSTRRRRARSPRLRLHERTGDVDRDVDRQRFDPAAGPTLGYNGDNELTSSTPKTNTTTLATCSYSYDGANRVATGPITGAPGATYAYTPANSITADTTAFQSAAYGQDGELCWTLAGSSSNACGTSPTGATKYTYDASGDRLSVTPSSGNDESLGWEQASERLVCINTNGTTCSTSSPTSTTMVYTYNGDGERATSKLGSGSTTTFVWDGLQKRLLSNGSQDFIYGIDPTHRSFRLL